MEKGSKISKAKGVEICADLLYTGKTRKEILQVIAENYKASEKTVDNWIKEARAEVDCRLREDKSIRDRVSAVAVEEAAKSLNITKERILAEYAKLAFFDVRKMFTVDGGIVSVRELDDDTAGAIAGIENFDERIRDTGELLGTTKKIKIADKKAALDSLCRVLGYNAPTTVAQTDKDGNDVKPFSPDDVTKIINTLRSGIAAI